MLGRAEPFPRARMLGTAALTIAVLSFLVPHPASLESRGHAQGVVSHVAAPEGRPVNGHSAAAAKVTGAQLAVDGAVPSVITVDDGGDRASGGAARAEVDRLVAALTPDEVLLVRAAHVRLDLIPTGRKLTDLPDFAFLRGIVLTYGRGYDDVRGVGGVHSGPSIVYAVGSEEWAGPASYGRGFELAHETGHVIRHYALSADDERALQAAYAARVAAEGPWLAPSSYTAVNDDEYFAQCVAAYFGAPYTAGDSTYTRAWLETHDPPMAALLASVFPGASAG